MYFICKKNSVPTGGALRVELADRAPLAVFDLKGRFVVTNDTCTHGDASLCDGEIEDGIVECPFHQGAFEIESGKVVAAPCAIPLKVYRTETRGDEIFADIAG